jgi:hypothetical protein
MKSRSSRRTAATAPRARRPLVETLEDRRLLSISVLRGALNITGTGGDDVIIVSVATSQKDTFAVSVNGRLNGVEMQGVKRINISGLAGNDMLLIDETNGVIDVPVNLAGGNGNDTLGGGSGPDLLQGGRGNDLIRGGAAGDVIEGYYGNDTLYGGSGKDNVYAGAGTDTIYTGGERREVVIADADDTIDRTAPSFQPPIKYGNTQPNLFRATPLIGALTPAQVRTAYGIDSLGLTGAGQTIAIVDAFDAPTIRSDLQSFSAQYGLTDITRDNFQVYYATKQRPNYDAGWSTEASLDVQWAHAIAPDAKIILVEARTNSNEDLLQAYDRAVELLQADGGGVISLSLGRQELDIDPIANLHFRNENTSNVSFVVATGDDGAMAGFPAISPDVTAVGGTFLDLDAGGNLITPESGWPGSGGGLSSFFTQPDFQKGVTVAGGTLGNRRAVPDLAMLADPRSGVSVLNSSPDIFGSSGWNLVGGTSLATPLFAGVTALINQRRAELGKGVIGDQLNNAIYQAADEDYAGTFNDITSGTNGYSAVRGYDLVTGLGSPKPGLVEAVAQFDTPSTQGANVTFEAARIRFEPTTSNGAAPQLFFGGTGFASKSGNQWDLELLPSDRSGVSLGIDGPLTLEADGRYHGTGTIEVITGPTTSVSYLINVVARETDGGGLTGEFYAVSRRGKILYQGDKPLFYGTFDA